MLLKSLRLPVSHNVTCFFWARGGGVKSLRRPDGITKPGFHDMPITFLACEFAMLVNALGMVQPSWSKNENALHRRNTDMHIA